MSCNGAVTIVPVIAAPHLSFLRKQESTVSLRSLRKGLIVLVRYEQATRMEDTTSHFEPSFLFGRQ